MDRHQFRALIKRAGIRQSDAGWLVGVSDRNVRSWLSGQYEVPQYASLILQAYVDGLLKPEWLADHIDKPMP